MSAPQDRETKPSCSSTALSRRATSSATTSTSSHHVRTSWCQISSGSVDPSTKKRTSFSPDDHLDALEAALRESWSRRQTASDRSPLDGLCTRHAVDPTRHDADHIRRLLRPTRLSDQRRHRPHHRLIRADGSGVRHKHEVGPGRLSPQLLTPTARRHRRSSRLTAAPRSNRRISLAPHLARLPRRHGPTHPRHRLGRCASPRHQTRTPLSHSYGESTTESATATTQPHSPKLRHTLFKVLGITSP